MGPDEFVSAKEAGGASVHRRRQTSTDTLTEILIPRSCCEQIRPRSGEELRTIKRGPDFPTGLGESRGILLRSQRIVKPRVRRMACMKSFVYASGEEVRRGDRITYGNEPGEVE